MRQIANIIGHVFYTGNAENLTVLFRDELALERAIDFTGSFGTASNVLGASPKTSLAAWSLPDNNEYPPRRTDAWISTQATSSHKSHRRDVSTLKTAEEAENKIEGIPAMEAAKHRDIKTVSLIREVLWNEAGWTGAAFAWTADEAKPPFLALLFSDDRSAELILRQWREELGSVDAHEALRVTIIRGIDENNPFAYRVVIGANPESVIHPGDEKYLVMLARMCTMRPSSGVNLNKFIECYSKVGKYVLTYATSSSMGLSVARDRGIEKREVHIRDAWQIGINDPDMVGISIDDAPIVPSSETDAPVHQLLRWRRKLG